MGVKDLWTILGPYCERRPLCELQGKIVAIDLSGWVCESLNVVDYFIHPRQYLKNLYFRTCYLLLENVIPVFVLEGKAPELKEKVISKRNEIQFRGVRPRKKTSKKSKDEDNVKRNSKLRTRFNHVLKQCENLLRIMGIQCVKGPGEAEAFCAFLNKKGLVDGIISQDSDCFAYGALRVYRNFSVCSQGTAAAQGGSVDIYDMEKICSTIDFGQNKVIAMALLCGCDYCPDGVEGVGKDAILKLFEKYKDNEILERIKDWRKKESYYTALELKVDDKNICTNCGHLGKLSSHTRNGCSSCVTIKTCNESLWREQRLAIKAEIGLRRKALMSPDFPSNEIINEFLLEPKEIPKLNLQWSQPNLVQFIRTVGCQMEWTEIYCFQKFLPLLTRWQIVHYRRQKSNGFVAPQYIKKKRAPKGIPSFEIVWKDEGEYFVGLIPDEQIQSYVDENPKGLEDLWSTVEPIHLIEVAYPDLVEVYMNSKQKKAKTAKGKRNKKVVTKSNSLSDLSDIIEATEEITKKVKRKSKKTNKGLQKIDKYLIRQSNAKKLLEFGNCSTPKNSSFLLDLDYEDEDDFNYSEIIKSIVSKAVSLKQYAGKELKYDNFSHNNESKDDLFLASRKRNRSIISSTKPIKRMSLMKSLKYLDQNDMSMNNVESPKKPISHVDLFLLREGENVNDNKEAVDCNEDKIENKNVSFFFENSLHGIDEFEKSVEISFLKKGSSSSNDSSSDISNL